MLDATDLTERLRYAVEPETSRALCERHLGAVPGDLSVPSSARVRRRLSPAVLSVALLSLVGAVLVAAALGALGGPAGEASSGAETVTPAGPPQPSPIGQGVTADGVNTAEAQVDVDAGQLPPGVATAGLSDLDVLARAHASALGNRSYTIRLTRTRPEIRDREVTQVRREVRLRVEGDRYLAESVEVVDGQRRRLATLYHDGSETYLASVREGSYERVEYPSTVEHFPPAPGNLSDRVVRARLADSTTTLAGTAERHGERLYRVDAERRQAALDGTALISHESVAMVRTDGLVRAFRTNYSYLGGDTVVDARRELVYDRIGETTVDPPDWYREEFGGGT